MRRRSLLRRVAVGRARATIIGVSVYLYSRDKISAKRIRARSHTNRLSDKTIQFLIGNQLTTAFSGRCWMLMAVSRPRRFWCLHRLHPAFYEVNAPSANNDTIPMCHQILTLSIPRRLQITNPPIAPRAIFKRHILRYHWIIGLPRLTNRDKQRSRRCSGWNSCASHIWTKHFHSLLPCPT